MKRERISNSFTGFPVITKLPWDNPSPPTTTTSEEEEEEEEHVVEREKEIPPRSEGGERKRGKEIIEPSNAGGEISISSSSKPPIKKFRWGDENDVTTTTTGGEKVKDKKEISFFTCGFPSTITKLPLDPPPTRKEELVVVYGGERDNNNNNNKGKEIIEIPPPSDAGGERKRKRERDMHVSFSFTGFPVITKLPWDPPPPPTTSEEEEEERVVAGGEREKDNNNNNNNKGKEIPPPSYAGGERDMNGSSSSPIKKLFRVGGKDEDKDKKEISFFTGFPSTITKFPWELPKKKYLPSEGIQIPKFPGWPEDGQVIYVDQMGREHIHYDDHRNYDPNSLDNIWPVPTESCAWWPVPSLDGFDVTIDPGGNKIRTPYIEEDSTKPPPIVEFNPNEYPYTWKPEIRDHYYAQLKESEGFDVDPIPGVHMYSLTVPMNHLGTEKKQCELVARMAVDEYNRRYKDDKGELKFGKIIKVMVKVVGGFIYYLTAEAINLSSEMPVTFQTVVFTGVGKNEVTSFRFISDSKKEPWLWEDDTCS